MKDFLALMRPLQWVKNILVFAPLFFAGEFFSYKFYDVFLFFVQFSLVASASYSINDILDRGADSLHNEKRSRPVASGAVSVKSALYLSFFLYASSALLAFFFTPSALPILVAYAALSIIYSSYLKNIPIIDIIVVASFYLFRIEGGGIVSGTPISSWLVLCTFFAALFLVIAKRRAEATAAIKRPVLAVYNVAVLEYFLVIALALTAVSYGIYTVLGPLPRIAVYSNILVMAGLFRYLALSMLGNDTEFPEKLFFKDKIILGAVAIWGLFMGVIIY